jgi:hypothetical protein
MKGISTNFQKRYNDTVPDHTAFECLPSDKLVEVHLWEAFLLGHLGLSRLLSAHSYDQGAFVSETLPLQRMCYRFTGCVWNDFIKTALNVNRVPVTIKIIEKRELHFTPV